MKIDASVTISRRSDDTIHIMIRDESTHIQFVDVSMTLHDFAQAVTGLAEIKSTAEVYGLQHVGKRKIVEDRQMFCPIETYDQEKLKRWLEENGQETGWILNPYLGSQNSVQRTAGGTLLNYSVYHYEDLES